MVSYRIKKVYGILLSALVVVSCICCPSFSQVADSLPLDDPNAVIRAVLSAIRAIELPVTGRGIATMTTENYTGVFDGKELIVDFVFKDQKSRKDIFESTDGIKGSRIIANGVSDKYFIEVGSSEAFIQSTKAGYRGIGRNFHPEVFMKVHGHPITHWLEGFLKPGINVSVKMDNEGLLHIVGWGQIVSVITGKEYVHEIQLSFDTLKNFLPVLSKSTQKHPDKWASVIVQLQWSKFDSGWYVSRAEQVIQPGNRRHISITVNEFNPNADVKDEEFTLNGMGVPDGLPVVDKVTGVSYRYGTPIRALEDLEKPLEEANFVKKIQEQQTTLVSQTSDANAQKRTADQNQLTIGDTNSLGKTTIGQTSAHLIWLRGAAITGVMVLIGIFVFLGYRKITRTESE